MYQRLGTEGQHLGRQLEQVVRLRALDCVQQAANLGYKQRDIAALLNINNADEAVTDFDRETVDLEETGRFLGCFCIVLGSCILRRRALSLLGCFRQGKCDESESCR